MNFRWEEDLRSSFRLHTSPSDWWPRSARTWNAEICESTCSDGRADLVWGALGEVTEQVISRETTELLQRPICSRILSLLKPVSERTFTYLHSKTGLTHGTVRSALGDLSAAGLVVERDTDRFVLGDQAELPQAFVCAFEFKLKNWRRAVFQATRYRTFSHRVFVVMPLDSIGPALKNLETFTALNIGLIGHDPDGVSTVLSLTKRQRPRSRHHYIRAIGMLLPVVASDANQTA